MDTRDLSYRVFYFTIYCQGLRLEVGYIDAARMRVYILNAKDDKNGLIPLPLNTLPVLRQFWALHKINYGPKSSFYFVVF